MTTPSFEKIDYALRPAKSIERKMFCETFARMSRIAPLRTYRYIGFGSIGFLDFSLLHRRLGIVDMLSIESREDAKDRVEFNKPYSCIDLEWGTSDTVLPMLEWGKRTILWLDYDEPLDSAKLSDIQMAVGTMRSGSIIAVTVDAKPRPSAQDKGTAKARIDDLKERVGKKITAGLHGRQLGGWGTAAVARTIIQNEIEQTLLDRNGALSRKDRLSYDQLFNFHYADGAKMLTVGGILWNERDRERLPFEYLHDLDFIRRGQEAYHIEVPILTRKEVRRLDEHLPGKTRRFQALKWLPKSERTKYQKVYRYYPNYSEVEA